VNLLQAHIDQTNPAISCGESKTLGTYIFVMATSCHQALKEIMSLRKIVTTYQEASKYG
jgi:hypothetical protein